MNVAAAMLCAGLGTRLRPLTEVLPKPLVPLGDRPLVDHAVGQLWAAGIRHFGFNAYHLPSVVRQYVADRSRPEACFRCVTETELLGTAGGVRGIYEEHEHLVVWNGDIFAPDLDVVRLLAARASEPVLVVSPLPGDGLGLGNRGTLGLDRGGNVVRLRGQTWGPEHDAADYVGVALLPRQFILTLPRSGCLVGDGLLPWLARGKPVTTHVYEGHWSDGGTVSAYLQQNGVWLQRRPDLGGSFLGTGVQRAPGVVLRSCVVGQGAEVQGEGELGDCVVWPGATAHAPLQRAVLLPDGRVVRPAEDATAVLGERALAAQRLAVKQ